MKILYFGSDYYSTIPLKTLIESEKVEIAAVVTTPKAVKLPFPYRSIHEIATGHNIQTFRASSKTDLESIQPKLKAIGAELGLVCSFGLLLPSKIYNTPKHGTYNIHPSLLPLYRGASPVQQTILDNQPQTGVTVMQINEHFDTGNILIQEPSVVFPSDTTNTLLKRLFNTGTQLFIDNIGSLNNPVMIKQDDTKSSTTHKFKTDNAEIDWQTPLTNNLAKVKAFYPKPIGWTYLSNIVRQHSNRDIPKKWNNILVKIFQAEIRKNKLYPLVLQIEGKKLTSWPEFALGYL